ncbi:RNA polymerase Rpb1 [Aureococcus anophagefferens virus]|nr:RNA polymerase Rpb1 [Aureococcus anophagefferens virus]
MLTNFNDENDNEFIESIEFSILSTQDMRNIASCTINSHETFQNSVPVANGLFDLRMGTLDSKNVCESDMLDSRSSAGYFGLIELEVPVFNNLYFTYVQKILKCVCFKCGSLLIENSNNISKKNKLAYCVEASKKVKYCPNCNVKCFDKIVKTDLCKIHGTFKNEEITIDLNANYVLNLFKQLSDNTIESLGFNDKSHPINMILEVLLVIPPCARPSVTSVESGTRMEDDLTLKYSDIIKYNNLIKKKLTSDSNSHLVIDYSNNLQYHIATLMDNEIAGIMQASQRSGRPLKGIRQRIKGKEGRIRGNLMGKRVDFSARSVITPDSQISLHELGVPIEIALKLTFPEKVNEKNIKHLRRCVLNGNSKYPGARAVIKHKQKKTISLNHIDLKQFSKMLEINDIVIRHLNDNDWVLFNRQPSLHKMSMMAHKVKVLSGLTFRLNVSACTPYNADFDGDEMNMHVPQSKVTMTELSEICSVSKLIISPAINAPIIEFVQDICIGYYLMTLKESKKFDLQSTMNIISRLSNKEIVLTKEMYDGFDLLSFCIPNTLSCILKNKKGHLIEILNGKIEKTHNLDKKFFNNLIHIIFKEFGSKQCSDFFDSIQIIVNAYLIASPFSVGCSDIINTKSINKKIDKILTDSYENAKDVSHNQLSNYAMKIRSDCENLLNSYYSNDEENRLMSMIKSGSKGKLINIAQITALLGQQVIDGDRIECLIDTNRTLPLFSKFDNGLDARGFISSSFKQGLSPSEYFFHAISGRDGVIDTACKTASIGYLQRKLMKTLEDIHINSSNIVIDSNSNVIQYIYGNDNFDPIFVESMNIPQKKRYHKEIKNISNEYDNSVKFPINIERILFKFSNECKDNKNIEQIDEDYVISEYNKLFDRLKFKSYNNNTNTLKFLLYVFAEPKILKQNKFTKENLSNFIEIIETNFKNYIISNYENVGAVAAQSIGEPATQLTLNSFHTSGAGGKGTVTTGVPRLNELLSNTKNPKATLIKTEYSKELEENIKKVTLNDVLNNRDIKYNHNVTNNSLDDKNESKYTLILYINQKNIYKNALTLLDVMLKLLQRYKNITINSDYDDYLLMIKMKKMKSVKSKQKSELLELQEIITNFDKIILKGFADYCFKDTSSGQLLIESSIDDIIFNDAININDIISSDINEMLYYFGLEIARSALINEIYSLLHEACDIDIRHIELLVDYMINSGNIVSIDRNGARKNEIMSMIQRITFEESVQNIQKCSVINHIEDIKSTSASILTGTPIKTGTGSVHVSIDEEAILRSCKLTDDDFDCNFD